MLIGQPLVPRIHPSRSGPTMKSMTEDDGGEESPKRGGDR